MTMTVTDWPISILSLRIVCSSRRTGPRRYYLAVPVTRRAGRRLVGTAVCRPATAAFLSVCSAVAESVRACVCACVAWNELIRHLQFSSVLLLRRLLLSSSMKRCCVDTLPEHTIVGLPSG